jgi:hypothetical protein
MKNENTQSVVAQQEIDLRLEAKKNLYVIVSDSLKCTRKPLKDFANSAIDYCINRFIAWVDNKLSV